MAISELLTTISPNRMPLTGFFDAEILEVAKHNLQALVAAATGINFTSDLTVAEGHKHETTNDQITWRQLVTFPLFNRAGSVVGAAPHQDYDATIIDSASSLELAVCRLFISVVDAAGIVPRVRVSNDNSATTNCTLTLAFYELDLTTLVLSTTIVLSTATARNRVWVDGSTIDLSAALADVDIPSRLPLVCLVSGILAADTEDVALHEIAFGVAP